MSLLSFTEYSGHQPVWSGYEGYCAANSAGDPDQPWIGFVLPDKRSRRITAPDESPDDTRCTFGSADSFPDNILFYGLDIALA